MDFVQPVKRSVVSNDIIEQILGLIGQSKLAPGQKLPSERELAKALNVSRASLRESISTLAYMNILQVRSGDGTYVTTLDPEILVEPFRFMLNSNESLFLDLLEARQIIEPGLAALAAHNIEDDEAAKLVAHLEHMHQESSLDNLSMLDVELHLLISKAARNPILHRLMKSLWDFSKMSRQRTITISELRRQAVRDHQYIVESVVARDAERAEKAMRQHLLNVRQHLQRELNDHTSNVASEEDRT